MSDPLFVHLRVHSDFSMSDGLSKVKPILAKVSELGMPAVALTDQTNMCGLVKFYGGCHGAGIKPIIGTEFWVQVPGVDELCSITAIAMNNEGYSSLTLLISDAYLRGHIDDRAVIDHEWLAKYNDGLILLSGGRQGDVGRALLKDNYAQVESLVEFYQTHFPDRYYLELLRTGRPDEERYLHMAIKLAQAKDLPVVATNQVVFNKPEQFEAHEIRVAISDGFTLADPRRPKKYSDQQYFKSSEEMCELFEEIPSR